METSPFDIICEKENLKRVRAFSLNGKFASRVFQEDLPREDLVKTMDYGQIRLKEMGFSQDSIPFQPYVFTRNNSGKLSRLISGVNIGSECFLDMSPQSYDNLVLGCEEDVEYIAHNMNHVTQPDAILTLFEEWIDNFSGLRNSV